MTEQFQLGALSCWRTAPLFRNTRLDHGMHLITQPVHVKPSSNSATRGNNRTNRILYHDIAVRTMSEPPLSHTVGTRHSGLQAGSETVVVICCYELCKSSINPITNPNPIYNHSLSRDNCCTLVYLHSCYLAVGLLVTIYVCI
jgi:hypothetical protein